MSIVENVKDRAGKDHSYHMNTKKVEDLLNWRSLISLEEGLISTIQWVNDNYSILSNIPTTYQHKI